MAPKKPLTNDEEVELLMHKPHDLLLYHTETIRIIVRQRVLLGRMRSGDADDHIQTVQLRLLETKLKKMQEQYDGSARVSTYLSKIILNICIEIERAQKPRSEELSDDDLLPGTSNTPLNETIVAEELNRFSVLLSTYGKSQSKLELCLKVIFRLNLTDVDILAYCRANSALSIDKHDGRMYAAPERAALLAVLNRSLRGESELTDKEIYTHLTPLFNACEGKSITPDAVRKWVDAKVAELLRILNGKHRRAAYTLSGLERLVELYYEAQNDTAAE